MGRSIEKTNEQITTLNKILDQVNEIIKWGIIGPGKISHKFASDLKLVDGSVLTAVASRDLSRAQAFADQYEASNAYGSYDEILEDSDVDILYIATPHTFHAEWAIKALNHGKNILCEKPLGINKSEVKSIIECARKNNCFMMEALWSRFNPTIIDCLNKIEKGIIGEPNHITADFTFYNNPSEEGRLLNMDLAGGSLLDIGIYPIFLAYLILGMPESIKAHGIFHHNTGADIQVSTSLLYKNATAQLSSSIMTQSEMVAKIAGKKGAIYLDSRWHEAKGYTIKTAENEEHIGKPIIGFGYSHEIIECVDCIRKGKKESEKWTHQNSLDLITIMDQIRSEIGLKYPFE
ncbi:MAG: Gfo/Idh/MocA family oxidoreductase [Saprospiraceae bacterium]|nr:Gfo/Idh/MocA family oxidoreductase [Saprospiraceae bacterium]